MKFLPFQILGNRSNIEKMVSNVNLDVAAVNFTFYFNKRYAPPLEKWKFPFCPPQKFCYILIYAKFMNTYMSKKLKKSLKNSNTAALSGLERRYDTEPDSHIDRGVLETIPYEYPGQRAVVDIDTNEFTAVCPYSGLPDFGTIKISYIPGDRLIELRSLKYYLFSYRNVGAYQEHIVNMILEDLVRLCAPRWMSVTADYNVRGGVHTVATVEHGRKE
jgi:7-cyano-7-deazaguanine reductase